jgi:hypothetical protein
MTGRERFLIGGVGGLAPVLMFLATGDFQRFFAPGLAAMAVGYLVRAVILFFVGGFVVWLYRDESQRIKAFQLGVGAPAMIAGLLATTGGPAAPPPSRATLGLSLIPVVYAQTTRGQESLKHFTLPVQSPTGQFIQGLTGAQPKNVWFVIAGSYLNLDSAKAEVERINRSFSSFHADAYAPYGDSPYYAVVIGANLTQEEARALTERAINSGLPKDTYYKTFPNLPLP